MALAIELGLACENVVDKFKEFAENYQSVSECIEKLLDRSTLLTKKYWFTSRQNANEWFLESRPADEEQVLGGTIIKLDEFVSTSRLDSRASAIEELLFSPDQQFLEETFGLNQSSLHQETETVGQPDLLIPKKSARSSRKRKPKLKADIADFEESLDFSADANDANTTEIVSSELSTSQHQLPSKANKWRKHGNVILEWYTCIVCSQQMSDEETYMDHMKTHDTRSPLCSECGNYFPNMTQYEEHINNLTKDLKFCCTESGCKKKFQFHCRYLCHLRTHKERHGFQCNDCGVVLSSVRSMVRHVRGKHLHENPFQCTYCPKAFTTQPQLTKHIKDHISPKIYSCDQCPRTFTSKQGLVYHRLDHAGLKPHKCFVCGKGFRTRTDMLNHERIHSGERPFTCELCGKSFVEKNALRKHRTVHTKEKNYICSYCGRQFGYKCSLDMHAKKCGPDGLALKKMNKKNLLEENAKNRASEFQFRIHSLDGYNNANKNSVSGTDLLTSAAEALKKNTLDQYSSIGPTNPLTYAVTHVTNISEKPGDYSQQVELEMQYQNQYRQ